VDYFKKLGVKNAVYQMVIIKFQIPSTKFQTDS